MVAGSFEPAAAAPPTCTTSSQFRDRYSNYINLPTTSGRARVCELRSGDANSAVWRLQWNLNSCYGRDLDVDGSFGRQTREALIAVQRSIGVEADGVYGPITMRTMNWRYFDRLGNIKICVAEFPFAY